MPYERWQIGDWKSKRCPRKLVTHESLFWTGLYTHYTKGHLYRSGGVADQPALYLETMALIASLVEDARANDA